MNELKKWILNNIDMKILALIMAIILWFYISSEYNISAERYYDIEVFPVNLRPDLSIKDIRNQVSVGIEGPKNILENTSAQKISGTVDLSNIVDPGEYYVNVKTALPKNTELVKIIPNEVRINIEKITEKNIVVGYNLIGLPERGFSLEDEPTISPIDVKVIGPESALNKISKAIIDIDISSIKDDFFSEEEIIIYNESNEIVKNLQIEPKKVIASIKVGEGYPEKFLSIKPRIVGKPAPDYFITNIEANPSEIEVYGNYSKIANVDFLETIPIDVNGISRTLTVKIAPVIGEGIYLTEEQDSLIEVKIQVEEKEEEVLFEGIKIITKEASPFVDYQIKPEIVDIKIKGKISDIKNINAEEIKAFADLSDLEKEIVLVEVEAPAGIDIIEIIPQETSITIKK